MSLDSVVQDGPWSLLHSVAAMDTVITAMQHIVTGMLSAPQTGDVYGTPDAIEITRDSRRDCLPADLLQVAQSGTPVWQKQWMTLLIVWQCPGIRARLSAASPKSVSVFLDALPDTMSTHVFGDPVIGAVPPLQMVGLVLNYLRLSYFHIPRTEECTGSTTLA